MHEYAGASVLCFEVALNSTVDSRNLWSQFRWTTISLSLLPPLMAFPAPALETDVITFQPWDAYVIVEAVDSVGAAATVINLVGRALLC